MDRQKMKFELFKEFLQMNHEMHQMDRYRDADKFGESLRKYNFDWVIDQSIEDTLDALNRFTESENG
jgi:hypothetical protein